MVGVIEKVDASLTKALSVKNITENSRRAFKITREGDMVVFRSTWKTKKLTVYFPASAFPTRKSLVNVRKLLYVMMKAGLEGTLHVKLVKEVPSLLGPADGKYKYNGEIFIRARTLRHLFHFSTLAHELVHALQHVFDPHMPSDYTYFLKAFGYKKNPFEKQAFKWEDILAPRLFR